MEIPIRRRRHPFIKAGKKEIFEDGEIKPLEEIQPQKAFGDLTHDQRTTLKEKGIEFVEDSLIKSFGEAAATLQNLQKVNIVEPNYKRGPNITISTDKWKKPKSTK